MLNKFKKTIQKVLVLFVAMVFIVMSCQVETSVPGDDHTSTSDLTTIDKEGMDSILVMEDDQVHVLAERIGLREGDDPVSRLRELDEEEIARLTDSGGSQSRGLFSWNSSVSASERMNLCRRTISKDCSQTKEYSKYNRCWGWHRTHTYDLRGYYPVYKVSGRTAAGPSELVGKTYSWKVEASTDGSSWTKMGNITAYGAQERSFSVSKNLSGIRYIRSNTNGNGYVDFSEITVYKGYIYSYLNSNMNYGPTGGEIDGYISTAWMGMNPLYADKVRLSATWNFNGINVSVGTSGVGFSSSGSRIDFLDETDNDWKISNEYKNLTVSGYIVWRSESVTGAFKFGSQWYQVTAYDSDYM
jgi:hypothetical protein